MSEEIKPITETNLIANLNKKINEAVEKEWAEDHYGDISKEWQERKRRKIMNKIVDHLLHIGMN